MAGLTCVALGAGVVAGLNAPAYHAWRLQASDAAVTSAGALVVKGHGVALLESRARPHIVDRARAETGADARFRVLVAAAVQESRAATADELQVVVHLLEDEEPARRLAALKVLVQLADDRAFEALVLHAGRTDFRNDGIGESEATVAALMALVRRHDDLLAQVERSDVPFELFLDWLDRHRRQMPGQIR